MMQVDVAILGAGFSGCLAARALLNCGKSVLIVDRGRHPRFVIGESTTPMANLVWQQIAKKYNLPDLAPFAEYGTWKPQYPQIDCGLKRGFSYFSHVAGQTFTPTADHVNDLSVAASYGPADADTHWYRPDFDAFLAASCVAAGATLLEETEVVAFRAGPPGVITVRRQNDLEEISAGFVIDASGEAMVLPKCLGIPTDPVGMKTNSRAVFGHFTHVGRFRDQLVSSGARLGDAVFDCDDAALHHVFDGGWMWVLRFDSGVTSAGFSLNIDHDSLNPEVSAEAEFSQLLQRFPSIAQQFRDAKVTPLCGQIRRTGRLQRRSRQVIGPGWALLPFTAYGMDALHSTGNTHALVGIERLLTLLATPRSDDELAAGLRNYAMSLRREIDVIDCVVAGSYRAFKCFPVFVAYSMLYFAAATVSEQRRRQAGGATAGGFVLASEAAFASRVLLCHRELEKLMSQSEISADQIATFEKLIASEIAPYNIAGLCDPERQNQYPFTG